MSGVDTETLAEGFAAQGREELVGRFREAYAKALGTHADLVSFDSDRIEAMVQRSAEEADGLQWRRALAGVAARELGIDLGPALTHPAVARAHQLVGAPSYESALAALAVPVPLPETPAAPASRRPSAAPASPPPAAAEPDLAAVEAEAPFAVEAAEPDAVEAEAPFGVAEAELTEAELAEDELADSDLTAAEALAVEAELATVMPSASPEADPEPDADAEPEEALSLVDQPTMAYDALQPEPAPADADADAAADLTAPDVPEAPNDEVLAHRATDFAEEFMAGAPVIGASEAIADPEDAEAPVSDEFTFEQDALELPLDEEEVAEFGAVHLGGVASLPSSEEIALRLSEEGLDLLQDDGTIVGRLGWTDIAALEVTVPHGRRRRHNAPRLVVHTAGGSARFEVPGLSGEELQDRVAPLMARFGN